MTRLLSASRAAALLGDAADRAPAYLGIADALRLLITDGRIPAGTRLPSERELTVALGVSRTTVTRAYATLKEAGFLTSRQGSGSVASVPPSANVSDRLLNPEPGDPNRIDLTCAAPTAPSGVLAAYETALAQLPAHLPEHGYYPSGLPALREAVARRYDERGLPTDPEQIIVTSGALSALAVVVRAVIDSGDRVLMESPTYPNAIATLRGASARISGADIEQSGWATSSLVDTIRQVRPHAAYLMPDFQNPTGQLMDDEQRQRVAEALKAVGGLAVIDEAMAEMAIDDVAPALPYAAHAASAITLGSASKAFWGGLRIGWIRAPREQMAALVAARLTLDLGAPVLEQLVLVQLMAHRERVLGIRRGQVLEARSALVSALATELPCWRFRVPAGGLNLWCELPRPVSSALTIAAAGHGVQLAAGPLFAPEGGLERFVRLPFTRPPAMLVDAVKRLAVAWEEDLPEPAARRRQPTMVG